MRLSLHTSLKRARLPVFRHSCMGTAERIRTSNIRLLRPAPLPVGLRQQERKISRADRLRWRAENTPQDAIDVGRKQPLSKAVECYSNSSSTQLSKVVCRSLQTHESQTTRPRQLDLSPEKRRMWIRRSLLVAVDPYMRISAEFGRNDWVLASLHPIGGDAIDGGDRAAANR